MEPSEWGYALPYGLQPPGGFYLRFPLIGEERWILILVRPPLICSSNPRNDGVRKLVC